MSAGGGELHWAFVTGGGGDIGGAICDALAVRGFGIACVDLDGERAEATVARVTKAGGTARALVADVTDEQQVAEAARRALSFGDVRVLANNAGRANGLTMRGMDYATWRRDIAVNLDSAFLCIRALEAHLLERGGAIVNTASVNGLGVYGNPAYSTAKAALIHLTRCLAVEYGPFGVRVNAVAPGTVRTRAWNRRLEANPAVFEEVERLYPLGRVSQPEDVARLVAFLASDDAAMITGAVMTVDGGLTAGVPDVQATITQHPVARPSVSRD